MRPLAEMPVEVAAGFSVVLTDIDGTLTTDGRLSAAAYGALERLQAAGLAVAAITGRPAGWCDLIARFWPVAGVVGENGAFYFAYDHATRRMRRVFATDAATRASHRARLSELRDRILSEVPGAAVAADQPYREADLAIDYAEDVPSLPSAAVARIQAIFEAAGATAKVSSIHVNGWFGANDKLSMTRRFATDVLGVDVDRNRERVLFCGDSPNDGPMFKQFRHACGVANVQGFAGQLEALPGFVARGCGGEGFVEIASAVLAARARAAAHQRRSA